MPDVKIPGPSPVAVGPEFLGVLIPQEKMVWWWTLGKGYALEGDFMPTLGWQEMTWDTITLLCALLGTFF